MTHPFVEVLLAVTHFKMGFPPKVLIVQSVILVEKNHVVGQIFNMFEIGHVNEGMSRCYLFVMIVEANNNGDYGLVHHTEKPKCKQSYQFYDGYLLYVN